MGIIDKIESFVNETKEMSLKKVEKKIKDGYWEAEQDLKVGKHITLRDTKTNKRIVVYITEDLNEGKSSLIVSAVKKDIGLSEKQFKIAHLTGNIESPKNNDKCVIVFKNNGKPKFKVYTFDSSNKWVPGEVFTDSNKLKSLWKDFPNVDYNLNESSYEKDLDPKKKIVVKGVKGMKSKPFTKKFKNMGAFDKWMDTDEAGDYEVHQVMNEDFDDSELEELDSISEATFAQHMKKAIAAKERGDEKKTIYHLGNAKTARYAMKSTEISKNKELLDKYKEMTKNLIESELNESTFNEINEAEDRYKFLSDLIFDFEKKLMLFAPLYKELDSEVVKDIKSLEKECERVRKGRLYKIR